MVATVSVLMAAHTSEVLVWSLAYGLVDAAPAATNLLYFAFVNYTTLGYGDVVPVERWRLMGPMTAMNRVLLFGWSTAVIFEVLRKAMAVTASAADNPPRSRNLPGEAAFRSRSGSQNAETRVSIPMPVWADGSRRCAGCRPMIGLGCGATLSPVSLWPPICCRPPSEMHPLPTCRPRPASTPACSPGWSSGFSAAPGTRPLRSRPPSRCWSAPLWRDRRR